jgi:hypothetical protein
VLGSTPQKLVLLFSLILASGIPATASEKWAYTPMLTGINMSSVVWGGGQFVAVGKYGAILTSPDGSDWVVRGSGSDVDLSSVAWAEEAGYVVMGDSGRISLTSVDGISWTKNETYLPVGTYFVGYAGGKFFASSPLGSIFGIDSTAATYYSVDGVSWEIFADFRLNSIAYGNDVFVSILNRHYHNIFISSDGKEWEYRHNFDGQHRDAWCWLGGAPFPPSSDCYMPSPPMPLKTVAYGNNVFLAGSGSYMLGEFGWSEDGIYWNIPWAYEWENGTVIMRDIWRGGYHHIIYDGVRFVVVQNNGIYSTTNGQSLELIYSGLSNAVAAITSDGDTNIVLITDDGQVGLLTKDTSSVSVIPRQPSPRPFSNFTIRQHGRALTLRLPERGNVAVYALNGAKIRAFDLGQGAHTLRLNDLPRGMYVVKANSGAWKDSVRMLIK